MEKEIKINEFFTGIKKRLWLVITTCIVITLLTSFYYAFKARNAVPLYQSSATYLLVQDNSQQSNVTSVIPYIIKDQSILDTVNQRLALNQTTSALASQISVDVSTDSPILKITVSDPNSELAAKIANTTGTVILQQLGNLFGMYNNKTLSIAKPARAPTNVSSGNHLSLGLVIGIACGIGLALLLEAVDDTVKSINEAERLLALPVLGSVSKMNRKNTMSRYSRRKNIAYSDMARGGAFNASRKEI